MYVIVVYDTAAERNPQVLKSCRQYLHHVQRSVFEGHLSPAQLLSFQNTLQSRIDRNYDHILVYTFPPGATPERVAWGVEEPRPSDVL